MTPGDIMIRALIIGFIISLVVITGFAYTTLLERKLLARLQSRIGPNRAGYIPIPIPGRGEKRILGGIMQPAADAVKLFFKEDPTPAKVDKIIYNLAPMLTVIPAILILAVIPWAPAFQLGPWEFTPLLCHCAGDQRGRFVRLGHHLHRRLRRRFWPAGRPTASTRFWAAFAPRPR